MWAIMQPAKNQKKKSRRKYHSLLGTASFLGDSFCQYFKYEPFCEVWAWSMDWICVLGAHLPDLLYLGPSLPDEGATLAGRDDQPEGNRWLGADGAVGHQCS